MKILFIFFLLIVACFSPAKALKKKIASEPIAFWDQTRNGTNFFNKVELSERYIAAKNFGVEFVRLAPNDWLNGRSDKERGDFLIGPSSQKFEKLNENDLIELKRVLDMASKAEIKIILTVLALPGARVPRLNGGTRDLRLWTDASFQEEAILFWKLIAKALKGHSAVVGYNIINEPVPEWAGVKPNAWDLKEYQEWAERIKGSPADLNLFYGKVVKAIRKVDSNIPIILDSGLFASARAFKILKPVQDKKIIYSFHFYDPHPFTHQHKTDSPLTYPGEVPISEDLGAKKEMWDQSKISSFLSQISDWQKEHKVPKNRILVGEFGVYRRAPGALNYLEDAIGVFNNLGIHKAFYSFREDKWDAMDYELGDQKPVAEYWNAIKENKIPGTDVYKQNPLSDLLRKQLKK